MTVKENVTSLELLKTLGKEESCALQLLTLRGNHRRLSCPEKGESPSPSSVRQKLVLFVLPPVDPADEKLGVSSSGPRHRSQRCS